MVNYEGLYYIILPGKDKIAQVQIKSRNKKPS
jgi:hypothetical protein